ncbi:hypothetical protein [Leifsonia sp. Root112D2]|uniref:hypothetical protein n=1 Tax=Leifsonia sp. Root112D2 TaxID=1736426 RepID=UPI0012FC5F6C|nr:hypothetical protein [Leifsonia sp. Root112D2]
METASGTRVLVLVACTPTGEHITVVTRFTPSSHGSALNGVPMTVKCVTDPRVGERWHMIVLALDPKHEIAQQIAEGGVPAYVTTPIVSIRRLE